MAVAFSTAETHYSQIAATVLGVVNLSPQAGKGEEYLAIKTPPLPVAWGCVHYCGRWTPTQESSIYKSEERDVPSVLQFTSE
jgi:hypothetical protein